MYAARCLAQLPSARRRIWQHARNRSASAPTERIAIAFMVPAREMACACAAYLCGGVCRLLQAGQRLRNHIAAVLRRIGHAFGAHEADVADAQEAEQLTQVALLEIVGWVGIDAAARAGDDDALAAGKASQTIGGVMEGSAAEVPRSLLCWDKGD